MVADPLPHPPVMGLLSCPPSYCQPERRKPQPSLLTCAALPLKRCTGIPAGLALNAAELIIYKLPGTKG